MSIVNQNDGAAVSGGGWFGGEPASYAGVVLNAPVDRIWTSRVPERLWGSLLVGQRVKVPLGRGDRPTVGYCVSLGLEAPAGVESGRIKEVLGILDDPRLIDERMLELTRWISRYYACSWGQALDAVVPAGVKRQAGTRLGTFLVVPEAVRARQEEAALGLTKKQAAAFAVLCASVEALSAEDAARRAQCGVGTVAELRKKGLVLAFQRRLDRIRGDDEGSVGVVAEAVKPAPTVEQSESLARLLPALEADEFAPFLLQGVTGSGKTEVYLSAIEHVTGRGREAIVLVPEISLTPQTIRRFRRRFARVAVLHSGLRDVERHRHWRSIAEGEVQVVVGARSAVFAPTRRLGLIVIDEEHESTFKQDHAPRYHARDVAVKRAQLEGVPIVLGSATPSLESRRNAELGRYTRLLLSERVNARPMPEVTLVDMKHEKGAEGGVSGPLRFAMSEALEAGGQVMLLLNRRGFHTFALCPKCGAVVKCGSCDVALTYHRGRRVLLCHTCDAEQPRVEVCPSCRAGNLYYGGIGTERLEREVRGTFPEYTCARMDSDTMRRPGSHEEALSAFKAGEVRILLGTQMIAKGLDFPNVTLVGVVNADTALHLPDFRAGERTFQLVAQVAGRTGRGDRPGKVLVQTFAPEEPAIEMASRHDYEGFAALELPRRALVGAPPYGRIARVLARGESEGAVEACLGALAEALQAANAGDVRILGPAPAPVTKVRDQYRFHLQLRSPTVKAIQALLHNVVAVFKVPAGVEIAVDVDPVSML